MPAKFEIPARFQAIFSHAGATWREEDTREVEAWLNEEPQRREFIQSAVKGRPHWSIPHQRWKRLGLRPLYRTAAFAEEGWQDFVSIGGPRASARSWDPGQSWAQGSFPGYVESNFLRYCCRWRPKGTPPPQGPKEEPLPPDLGSLGAKKKPLPLLPESIGEIDLAELEDCIKRLPLNYRVVIELDIEGLRRGRRYTDREIADKLNITEAAVGPRRCRALRLLRECLQRKQGRS